MSYIEKEKLIKADIASIENRVRHAFNQGYDLGFKDGREKAKPQESSLDKIRAEIRANSIYVMPQYGRTIREADVLNILDKYTTKTEG
jgi:hypothetical protein